MADKVALDLKAGPWRPAVLPGQIILLTTVNEAGEPDIAPAGHVALAAPAAAVVSFRCETGSATYRNLSSQREFVINVPGEPLAEAIWKLAGTSGEERLRLPGLTLKPARAVRPPVIEECQAHLECLLDSSKEFGNEAIVFGKIVAASVDPACQTGTAPEQYFQLRPIFSLEEGVYGSLDGAKWFGAERSTSHPLFAVRVGDRPAGRDENVIKAHFAFLRGLRAQGRLLLGGPFPGGPGGLYIFTASSLDHAEETALNDPLVRSGAPHSTKPWIRTF